MNKQIAKTGVKILMISGSLPPEPCGVGDYTYQLAQRLQDKKLDLRLIGFASHSIKEIIALAKERIVHIQYPSRGYGKSLLPQFLAVLLRPVVVTLHEFSQVHILRKLAEIPFLLFSNKIIVTNEFEKKAIENICTALGRKTVVIPVSSAFVPVERLPLPSERSGLAFFGLMRKSKGVEEFIELARLIQQTDLDMEIHIYSAVPNGSEDYFSSIQSSCEDLQINWHINLPLEDVSHGLLSCKYAYLHYHDGLSERRSSFMAAISHGLIALSNSGPMTVEDLKPAFYDVFSASEALKSINTFESDDKLALEQYKQAIKVSMQYSPDIIADQHIQLYRQVVGDE